VIRPEVLDTLSYEDARANLSDIVELNRHWGGHSTLCSLLRQVANANDPFSLLDVGAASGDMGQRILEWYPNARVLSMDSIASHMVDCPQPKLVGDAFALPFRARAFDFVFCALFLHHFPDEEVVDLLRRFGQVARKSVLVVDLERNPLPYYFLPLTQPFFGWDAVTVNDGRISVEAAFKRRELESLAAKAGLKNARAKSYYPAFRVTLAADVY
jgi:ubiquinone/menaquinone biosynthesis C-methylase UbiE